jgi:hypothetical protein
MISGVNAFIFYLGATTLCCLFLLIFKKFLKSLMPQEAHETIPFRVLFPISIGFCFLGLTMGIFSGLSLSPVVGTIIPAFLTFLGGFITYLFTKENGISHFNRLIAIVCLIVVPPSLLLGGLYGIHERKKYEETLELRALAKEKAIKAYDYFYKQELILFEKSLENPDVDTVMLDEIMQEKD